MQTDKRYQLADWRIRPLQNEMLLYARMDTHYLLYMYDVLRVRACCILLSPGLMLLHDMVSICPTPL